MTRRFKDLQDEIKDLEAVRHFMEAIIRVPSMPPEKAERYAESVRYVIRRYYEAKPRVRVQPMDVATVKALEAVLALLELRSPKFDPRFEYTVQSKEKTA